MEFSEIIGAVKGLLGESLSSVNDEHHWGGWVSLRSNDEPVCQLDGRVSTVTFSDVALYLGFQPGVTAFGWTLSNVTISPRGIEINDILQPDAHVVVADKSSLEHLIRVAVDVRPVELGESLVRLNLRFTI